MSSIKKEDIEEYLLPQFEVITSCLKELHYTEFVYIINIIKEEIFKKRTTYRQGRTHLLTEYNKRYKNHLRHSESLN